MDLKKKNYRKLLSKNRKQEKMVFDLERGAYGTPDPYVVQGTTVNKTFIRLDS